MSSAIIHAKVTSVIRQAAYMLLLDIDVISVLSGDGTVLDGPDNSKRSQLAVWKQFPDSFNAATQLKGKSFITEVKLPSNQDFAKQVTAGKFLYVQIKGEEVVEVPAARYADFPAGPEPTCLNDFTPISQSTVKITASMRSHLQTVFKAVPTESAETTTTTTRNTVLLAHKLQSLVAGATDAPRKDTASGPLVTEIVARALRLYCSNSQAMTMGDHTKYDPRRIETRLTVNSKYAEFANVAAEVAEIRERTEKIGPVAIFCNKASARSGCAYVVMPGSKFDDFSTFCFERLKVGPPREASAAAADDDDDDDDAAADARVPLTVPRRARVAFDSGDDDNVSNASSTIARGAAISQKKGTPTGILGGPACPHGWWFHHYILFRDDINVVFGPDRDSAFVLARYVAPAQPSPKAPSPDAAGDDQSKAAKATKGKATNGSTKKTTPAAGKRRPATLVDEDDLETLVPASRRSADPNAPVPGLTVESVTRTPGNKVVGLDVPFGPFANQQELVRQLEFKPAPGKLQHVLLLLELGEDSALPKAYFAGFVPDHKRTAALKTIDDATTDTYRLYRSQLNASTADSSSPTGKKDSKSSKKK